MLCLGAPGDTLRTNFLCWTSAGVHRARNAAARALAKFRSLGGGVARGRQGLGHVGHTDQETGQLTKGSRGSTESI